MFPLYDTTPQRSFPFMNYLLILANIVVFFWELSTPDMDVIVTHLAFVPAQFSLFHITTYWPIFTAMFLHGSILHILSNMWFLHIFGDNVEDQIGHIPYLSFYLFVGFAAMLVQYFFDPTSTLPVIGASGAISGVAGAYYAWFRRAEVVSLVPIFFVFILKIPVTLFLGYWFVLQLFNGIGSLGTQTGGTAWFAHIGGFLAGLLLTRILTPRYAVE